MAGRAELDRGRGLRAKCKSLGKPTWNHHERRQNNSVENVFRRFAYFTFVWRIIFEEPRISEAQCLTWELAFWSPWLDWIVFPKLKTTLILWHHINLLYHASVQLSPLLCLSKVFSLKFGCWNTSCAVYTVVTKKTIRGSKNLMIVGPASLSLF